MSYETNPYYNPESRGLTIVAEIDDPQAFYSFNKFVVWTDGRHLLYADDSGCSCPRPFEDTEPERGAKSDIYRAADRWVDSVSEYRSTSARAEAQTLAIGLKKCVREWKPEVTR